MSKFLSTGRLNAIRSRAAVGTDNLERKMLRELIAHCDALEDALRRGATIRVADGWATPLQRVYYLTDPPEEIIDGPAGSVPGPQRMFFHLTQRAARAAKARPDVMREKT